MAEYQRFQWRQSKDGECWERDVDEMEMSYTSLNAQWRGSGRSFFHMTGHLTLEIPVQSHEDQLQIEGKVDAALPKAWLALRYHHPTIASQVKLDEQARKYVKSYPIRADGWLEETFSIISVGQTGAEWANADPPAPPLPALNIVVPPSTNRDAVRRDIVFRSPHDIIDGIGTLLLFDHYVRLAAEALDLGDAYQIPSLDNPELIRNLSPPFRVAANVPATPSDAIRRRLNDLEAAAQADLSKGTEVVTMPFRRGALVPGVHKRIEVVLSPEQTKRLTACCRSVGATVTHVFHAAIALVLRDLQPKEAASRPVEYVGYLLRNERPTCAPPYNDHRHAASVYHSVSGDKLTVYMQVPGATEVSGQDVQSENKRDEFFDVVDQMKKFYLKVRDDPDHYAIAPLLLGLSTNPIPTDPDEAQIVPPVPPPAETASATISSMGRIDGMIAHRHGFIDVYNPWVTGEELRSSLGLFLGTFRGQLSLSAAYNDAWHDGDKVISFVERCLSVVNEGFAI